MTESRKPRTGAEVAALFVERFEARAASRLHRAEVAEAEAAHMSGTEERAMRRLASTFRTSATAAASAARFARTVAEEVQS